MSNDFEDDEYVPNYKVLDSLIVEAVNEIINPLPAVRFKRFATLDHYLGGLRPREFTILCGATGTGKTTLLSNLSIDLAEQGIHHFVASVETGYFDYIRRLLSVLAKKDLNTGEHFQKGEIVSLLDKHRRSLCNQSVFMSLYENRFSVETLINDIKWFVENRNVKVAFIDNLNFFLEVTSASNALIEMDRVIHELIMFCKNYPVHIVMVMHPKKTDHGRVESEFDIKGSSTAVQEAHNVLLFNRPHQDAIFSKVVHETGRELLIRKLRRRGKFVGHKIYFGGNEVYYSDLGGTARITNDN